VRVDSIHIDQTVLVRRANGNSEDLTILVPACCAVRLQADFMKSG